MESISRLINTDVPCNSCNLRCDYCYIGQTQGYDKETELSLPHSFEHMRKSLTTERLGGRCQFNLCSAGETAMVRQLPELTELLLELGHVVAVVTNTTLRRPLERLVAVDPEKRRRLFVKSSFHYLELKRLNLLDAYFDNVALLKENGVSFSVEMIANDEAVPFIPEIKRLCSEHLGALPHVLEGRDQADASMPRLTKLPLREHVAAWASFDSAGFDYQTLTYEKKSAEFCYGGEFFIDFSLQTGNVTQCFGTKPIANLFDPSPPILAAIGDNCPAAHCQCRFFLQSQCGIFEHDIAPTPTYAETRDRICSDGSRWLNHTMLEIYSHRCSEVMGYYSEDKKYYIDLLMRKIHRGVDPTAEEKKNLAEILRRRIHGPVAMIGDNELTAWLHAILTEAKIPVKFTVNHEPLEDPVVFPHSPKNRLRRFLKYWIKRLVRHDAGPVPLYIFDRLPKVECIIAADYLNFGKFAEMLDMGKDLKSILQLAD